ncbi:MAG TPA: M15 family metallopeptidase [Polyangiaceae bacterium]|nr:M15 family metallopeptidase [Polyangiaceae bacterium]
MPDDAPLPDEVDRPDPPGESVSPSSQEGAGEAPGDEIPDIPTPGASLGDSPSGAQTVQRERAASRPSIRDDVPIPDWIPIPTHDWGRPKPTGLRQRLLLAVAFVAPSLVIAASVYFIVWGGQGRGQPQLGVIAVQRAPSSAPTQFPGEGDEDAAELGEPSSDAGHSLEQPNQVVPEIAAGEAPAPGAALPPGFEDETGSEEPAPSKPAPPKHFATVQEAAMGSCSTESVDGLSRQIIEQARCMKPNEFVPLPKRPNLVMAPNVYGYLDLGARDHLLRALDSKKSQTMTINSALRTVAQQYLVSHWSLSKICGVQMATKPGESNHEIGTALDIKEAGTWRPALEAQEFKWLGASDRVHFDYKSASQTRTATDVLAFQKLWNRNHKDDAITETGRFDAATEQRLKKSPPSGFALGASCSKARPR